VGGRMNFFFEPWRFLNAISFCFLIGG
jgi:hypothetical protein